MKAIVKKIFKALLIFIVSSIIIYLGLTIPAFCKWCDENQISMFFNSDELLLNLDSQKIKELGESVGNYQRLLEESLKEGQEQGYNSLAEYYDPLGFSVWSHMQMGLSWVLERYFVISILTGGAVAIAYVVITSKKLNNILKVAIGYLGVMIIVPIIYSYSYAYRIVSLYQTYCTYPIIYFYVGYTAIFALMYFINYRLGKKIRNVH